MNRNLGDGDREWIKLPIKLDLGVGCDLSHGIYSCSLGASSLFSLLREYASFVEQSYHFRPASVIEKEPLMLPVPGNPEKG